MESILNSTKKVLGLAEAYTHFDLDIVTFINSAFSSLNQLGVGPDGGFFITGADETWGQFVVPADQLNMVKAYLYLKVRVMFDPPTTSYLINSMDQQIKEHEWRLNTMRENVLHPYVPPVEEEV